MVWIEDGIYKNGTKYQTWAEGRKQNYVSLDAARAARTRELANRALTKSSRASTLKWERTVEPYIVQLKGGGFVYRRVIDGERRTLKAKTIEQAREMRDRDLESTRRPRRREYSTKLRPGQSRWSEQRAEELKRECVLRIGSRWYSERTEHGVVLGRMHDTEEIARKWAKK